MHYDYRHKRSSVALEIERARHFAAMVNNGADRARLEAYVCELESQLAAQAPQPAKN